MKLFYFVTFLILSLYFKLNNAQQITPFSLVHQLKCLHCEDPSCRKPVSKWCGCGCWSCFVSCF